MTASEYAFLSYFYQLLFERAQEAQTILKQATIDGENLAFAQGRALAYYEVIATFTSQVDIYSLDEIRIGIRPGDSDSLLN